MRLILIIKKKKLKSFTLIESLIALSIISIVMTTFTIILTNHFNIGKDFSNFKQRTTLDNIKIGLQKNNEPLEYIIDKYALQEQKVDFSLDKINESTYNVKITVSSKNHKGNIQEILIIHNLNENF